MMGKVIQMFQTTNQNNVEPSNGMAQLRIGSFEAKSPRKMYWDPHGKGLWKRIAPAETTNPFNGHIKYKVRKPLH